MTQLSLLIRSFLAHLAFVSVTSAQHPAPLGAAVDVVLPKFELGMPLHRQSTSLWDTPIPVIAGTLHSSVEVFYDVPFEAHAAARPMDFRRPAPSEGTGTFKGNFDSPGPGYREQTR